MSIVCKIMENEIVCHPTPHLPNGKLLAKMVLTAEQNSQNAKNWTSEKIRRILLLLIRLLRVEIWLSLRYPRGFCSWVGYWILRVPPEYVFVYRFSLFIVTPVPQRSLNGLGTCHGLSWGWTLSCGAPLSPRRRNVFLILKMTSMSIFGRIRLTQKTKAPTGPRLYMCLYKLKIKKACVSMVPKIKIIFTTTRGTSVFLLGNVAAIAAVTRQPIEWLFLCPMPPATKRGCCTMRLHKNIVRLLTCTCKGNNWQLEWLISRCVPIGMRKDQRIMSLASREL